MSKMILHCGGRNATLEEVEQVPTPEPTETHVPIPHDWFLDQVNEQLRTCGIETSGWEYALNKSGAQMFALAKIEGEADHRSQAMLGVRNAHDKSFQASFCHGQSVFVCDNLGFSSEVTVGRRHTRGIIDDLPALLFEAGMALAGLRGMFAGRYDAYEAAPLPIIDGEGFLLEMVDRGVFTDLSHLKAARYAYHNPTHPEFEEETVYRLFNAITEAEKAYLPNPRRTMQAHAVCDILAKYTVDADTSVTIR